MLKDNRGEYDSAFDDDLNAIKALSKGLKLTVTVADWSLVVQGEPTELFKFIVKIRDLKNPNYLGVDMSIKSLTVEEGLIQWIFH